LIVDDQVLFSELLQRTLASEPGLEVVGVAYDAMTAVQMAQEATPDVVLLDIELPGDMDGIEAGIRIKETRPETGIVILSVHNDRRYVTSLPLEEHSGWSYLLKQSVPDVTTLVRAIQGSMRGMVVLDPAIVNNLRPRQGSILAGLTPRQRDVLELMAQGYNNAAAAQRLVLTEKTVETYISAIYQQLHLSGESDIHARVKATLLFLQESQNL
jgi:DNA-binding NarL/FixJ family response regulator